jgi:hypothetical protein
MFPKVVLTTKNNNWRICLNGKYTVCKKLQQCVFACKAAWGIFVLNFMKVILCTWGGIYKNPPAQLSKRVNSYFHSLQVYLHFNFVSLGFLILQIMYFRFLSGHSMNSEYTQVIGSFVHSFFSISQNPYIILKIGGKLAGQLTAVIHGTIKGHIREPL